MLKKLNLNYYYLIYLYIFITPLAFSLFYQRQREEDFIFCLISSFLFVLPLYFFRKIKFYIETTSLLMLFTGVFDLVHIYLYQGRISSSIFFIILDTNPVESAEFISSNITIGLILTICLYLLGYAFLIFKMKRSENEMFKRGFSLITLFFILAPFGVKYLSSSFSVSKTIDAYVRSNQFFLMTETFMSYREQMKIFTDFSNKSKKIENVTRHKAITEPEVHVLVIGESTTSRHMSLYGYKRKTNPKLEAFRDELIIFNDVVNSHPPGTASNLKRINTLANASREDTESLSISLVNIMKGAGFKTYWISNQLLLGTHDTVTTALAKQADSHVFTNTTNSITYDEKLLPILENKLNDKNDKKFIVIHLFGTHMKYRNRFPEEFEKFTSFDDIEKKSFHKKSSLQYINDYDNSVLYNDFIVSEILNILKKRNEITSFIYLSDHGEEVYQTKNLHGHPSADTRGIYEIPFFAWVSQNYKTQFKPKYDALISSVDRAYVHDDLIHTLMDMYYINYNKFNPSLSLINPIFKPRPRYVDKIKK